MAESGDASAKNGDTNDLENRIIRQVEVRTTKKKKKKVREVYIYNVHVFKFIEALFFLFFF